MGAEAGSSWFGAHTPYLLMQKMLLVSSLWEDNFRLSSCELPFFRLQPVSLNESCTSLVVLNLLQFSRTVGSIQKGAFGNASLHLSLSFLLQRDDLGMFHHYQ